MSEVKTVRSELGGKFNINFRGGCTITQDFEYICLTCKEQQVIRHERSDKMHGRECGCGGKLTRYHDKPPALDGDYHDSCRSENIGWDENGG